MDKQELKQKIIEVMEQRSLGALATVNGDKPAVRYMVITMDKADEKMTMYTTTFTKSRKVAQLKENQQIQVTMGGDSNDWKLPYITIDGTAEIRTDAEIKNKCWEPQLEAFFTGPDDPNYAILEISPTLIEYMSPGSMQPEILEL